MLPFSLESLLPSRWAGWPGRYALFLLANLPVLTTVIMQVVMAHRLRRSRNPAYLVPLRRILWAQLLFSAVKLGIDKFFQFTSPTLSQSFGPRVGCRTSIGRFACSMCL